MYKPCKNCTTPTTNSWEYCDNCPSLEELAHVVSEDDPSIDFLAKLQVTKYSLERVCRWKPEDSLTQKWLSETCRLAGGTMQEVFERIQKWQGISALIRIHTSYFSFTLTNFSLLSFLRCWYTSYFYSTLTWPTRTTTKQTWLPLSRCLFMRVAIYKKSKSFAQNESCHLSNRSLCIKLSTVWSWLNLLARPPLRFFLNDFADQ